MRVDRVCSFLLAGALLLVSPVLAQETGEISGRIIREDGLALAGVTVTVNESGLATLTQSDGSFSFRGVEPGAYSVSFTLGDNTTTAEGVQVEAGQTARVDQTVDWIVSLAETITVFSASRRQERIVDAPSAVSVVSEVEIQRQTSHSQVPKLIEFTPGAEVTQSGIYDFNLNTRGFNSSLNRRVAVLVDGRDPSIPFLSSQDWSSATSLDDLESVEMVRGPSAALYGANASSGVLNMTTKAPRNSQGGQVRLTAGELSTFNTDLRWAGSLGTDWFFKIIGGTRNHDDWYVSRNGFAEYSEPCPVPQGSATNCLPQEAVPLTREDDEITQFALRLDKYFGETSFLTMEGGSVASEGPVVQTGIGRVQLVEADRPWGRLNYFHPRWNVLAVYNRRDAPMQTALSSGTNLVLDSENYNVEVQGNWEFDEGNSLVVIGGSFGSEEIDSLDPKTGRQTLMFEPIEADMYALFGQIDWGLGDSFRLVLAGRYDDSDLHDAQFSPKAALVYSINPKNTLRLTYNEAFQVPNYSEFFLSANAAPPADLSILNQLICAPFGLDCGLGITPILALGNQSLEVEDVTSVEIGYSGILGADTLFTLDYWIAESNNFITDLIPQLGTTLGRVNPDFGPWQAPPGIPAPIEAAVRANAPPILSNNFDGSNILAAVSYTNFGEVDTQGVDLGIVSQFGHGWSVDFTYSWFDFEVKEDLPGFENLLVPNSPENKMAAGVSHIADRWGFNISGRWVDDFDWAVGPFVGVVESYTTVDLSGEFWINEQWRLGLNVTNLFDDEHYQSFGGDLLGRRALGNVTFRW
jgi:iron complex outermembrane receptor protein